MTKRNIWAVTLIVLVIGLFWVSAEFSDSFAVAVEFIREFAEQFPIRSLLIFLALTVISALLFSFSSVWFLPVAIGVWGKGITFLLLLGGWIIGNIVSYLIGKYAGYPLVSKFVSEKKMQEYRELYLEGDAGFGIVFLSRFVLPSEIPGYILGTFRYRFWPYFLATLLSEAPYALIAVYAVDAVLRRDIALLSVWGGIWAICAVFLAALVRRKLRQRKSA